MSKYLLPALATLLISAPASAAIDLTSPSDTWASVLVGNNFDPGGDTQAVAAIDLTGFGTTPLFYMKYDDAGTPGDTSDDSVAFRFRADNAVDSQGHFSGYIWIGLDVDADNDIDAFMMLVGKNGAYSLDVYDAGTGANISPSTTDIGATPTHVTTGFSFNHSLVSAIDAGGIADQDNDGDPDYLISYSVNFNALAAALNAQTLTGTTSLIQTLNGGAGMTITTPFQLVVSSAQNSNVLNGDIGGFNDKVDNMATSYAELGAFSGVLSFSNPAPAPIPSGATSQISATPVTLVADGLSSAVVTVQLKDGDGNNLTSGGDTVVLYTTAGSLGGVADNGDGTYSATLTSSTTVGSSTITGTVNGSAISDDATVAFIAGSASGTTSLITATPATIVADGSSTSTVTVQLKDANGNNLSSSGDTVVLYTTAGTLGSVVDNHNGTYSVTLTASTSVGTATITGTVNGNAIVDDATVNFVQGIASSVTSVIDVTPASIVADGSSTATITVQLKDGSGNNLTSGGDTVALYTTAGTLSAVTDNHDGTYSATLTAGTSAATATISGTLNGSGMSDTATVEFTVSSLDSDNDGIPDSVEGNGDSDGDGIADKLDLDSDNDGIPDSRETDADSDGDGIPNYLDLDSDNDGMYDLLESGISNVAALDSNNNGRIDSNGAGDSNGLANTVESAADSGVLAYSVADSDGDGYHDYRDRDSDNDGINDVLESGGSDSDNDGALGSGAPSVDANGLPAGGPLGALDADGDTVPNYRDRDSDNDGLFDVFEADGSDLDGNGIVGDSLPTIVNGYGIPLGGGLVPVDTDLDGVKDYLDRDSDNDGIPDVTEAGGSDPDHDGVIGTGEPLVNGMGVPSGAPLVPVDSDHDGINDQRDLDADGDGTADIIEAGGTDTNGDGKVDNFSDSNGDGYDDGVAASGLPLPDSDGDGLADFQDADDSDNDGIPDYLDLDDDNDGIPDSEEGSGLVDSDGDGVPDSRDLDSDNDGIFDLTESGIATPQLLDTDNDGRIDNNGVGDGNGLADSVETVPDSGSINYVVADSDGDGVKDFRDLDSDNDGIPDVVENGRSDPDQDGRIGTSPVPVNLAGVAVGTTGTTLDYDNDGIPDYLDLDSDSDGKRDITEAGGADENNDGRVDNFTDANGDGYDDTLASAPLSVTDSNNDGVLDYLVAKKGGGMIETGLSGFGGCSVARTAPFDPLLPMLLVMALAVVNRGRVRRLLVGEGK